ncbi:MAG TPA: AMP-binding protein [Thermodesulfobacteriota bacterium]|nr:AMP-binding protein [Thermodesulfobacteriota bacterium]
MNIEKTIPALITNRIKKYQSKILFQRRDGWSWKQITWLDFERDVKSIASFLLDLGFGPGDAAIMVSPNRMECLFAEVAVCFLGGVAIPMEGDELLERIIEELAKGVRIKFIFTADAAIANRVITFFNSFPDLGKIIVFSYNDLGKDDRIIPYASVLKFGLLKRRQLEDSLTTTSESVSPDSPAVIFYDPGLNGKVNEKKVAHLDLIEALHLMAKTYPFIGEEDQSFSCLTSASPFEKFINYLALYMGSRIVMAETREDFFEDILEVKPTVLFETRDGLEDICSRVLSDAGKKSGSEKLRRDLGNRIKYVLTDAPPEDRIKSLFSKSGASIVEVPELNKLGEL